MNTFNGCTGLTTVTIPSSVKSIGMSAFRDCTNLSSINDISNVNDLGSNAFYNCSSLTSITIPSSVTTIPSSCFYGCTGLTSVTIPSGVTTIKGNAFEGCNNANLTIIAIPSTVVTIEGYAFRYCTGLTSVTIPSSVTALGSNAFQGCTGLTEINYNVTTLSDYTDSNKPFKGCSTNDITLTIGANVTRIPAYAFNGTKTTGTLIIPASVTSIGTKAFVNNLGSYTSLSTVFMLGIDPPSIAANDVFKTGYSSYCALKVFYSSDQSILTAYQEATNWSDFSSSISETDHVTIANLDLTNDSLTIPAGNTITVTGTLTNTDASHLVIEDGGQLIYNNTVNATLQKEITKAVVWGVPGADAWYFIASPVNEYATSNVIITGTSDTDLFSFDEGSSYWYNAQGSDHPFTSLTRGQGYLYANNTGDDLAFSGEMPATNSNIEKTLSYAGSGKAKGYNLMGNPFTCNLTTDNVKFFNGTVNTNITSYYTVENGTELSSVTFSGNPIKPGRGFMIQANGEGQKLVFNPGAKSEEAAAKPSIITIEAGNDQFMDRALIQFGNGNTLRKMTINDHVSHVYVVYDGNDYAAATITEMQGQIPVNFVAAKNGQYTIKVKTDNLETSYLHLIDNLTGANIDLLQTPSYTFQGNTTDISARFRLLFTTTGVDENEDESQTDFAFISDGQLIVNGTGTLYVYDALGRQVSVKQVTPLTSTLSPLTSGVYVLQLVDGNSVRTQKIIVK